MLKFDVELARSYFPPLKDGWAFVENAGGTYVPRQVIERVNEYMNETQVQPAWEFASSQKAIERIEEGKKIIAQFVNAEPDEVMIGPSTTMNIYLLCEAIKHQFKPGDEIIVSEQDHEANNGAWRRLMEQGLVIKEWRIDPETGALQYEMLDQLLTEKTRLVAFTHCSNVAAIVHDVPKVVKKIHAAGALVFIDGVAYAPHFPIDVKKWDVDFYAFSIYKTFGPHQGALYIKRELAEKARTLNHFFCADRIPGKILPGGSNHELTASLVGIRDYIDALYSRHFNTLESDFKKRSDRLYELFTQHEASLATPLLDFLRSKKKVKLVGQKPSSDGRLAPVVGFHVPGRSSHEIAIELHKKKIACGYGDFWARRLIEGIGLNPGDGVVRISFAHYNTSEEVDHIVKSLDEVLG